MTWALPLAIKEGLIMEEKWTYSLWGAAAGAAALAIVGFTWGGWVTGSNAEAMTLKRSQAAVVAVLTPICIERFQGNTNAPANLVALKNISRRGAPGLYRERRMGHLRPSRPFELADAVLKPSISCDNLGTCSIALIATAATRKGGPMPDATSTGSLRRPLATPCRAVPCRRNIPGSHPRGPRHFGAAGGAVSIQRRSPR